MNTKMLLILLFVLLLPAQAAPDENLWHRLASGDELTYLWKDAADVRHVGKTEVLACIENGVIRVRNSWLNQYHEFNLYSNNFHAETLEEPRIEWFASCNVFVKSTQKQVAYLTFVPIAIK